MEGQPPATRRAEERLLALHQAAVLLAAQRDPNVVLEKTLESAVGLLGAGSGTFYRWDTDAGLLRCAYNWRVPESDTTPDQRPGEGLAGQVFARAETLIVNDYPAWEHAMPSGPRAGLRAALSVPLIRGGATLGVVVVRAYGDTIRFTQDDARLLELFADQAALAMENAQLYDAAQRELAERRRAEAALRESEARHRAVVDTAFDGIITFDARGVIRTFNRGAERIYGYRAAEAVERPLALLQPEEQPASHGLRLQHALGGTREGIGRRADGALLPLEFSVGEVQGGAEALFTAIIRDITERKEFERRLAYQALHDPLTTLPNRALLLDRLNHLLVREQRRRGIFAVLFLDLDGFKAVNDRLGHEVGDHLLKGVAERLCGCVREADTIARPGTGDLGKADGTVARFGGDEFVALLENCPGSENAIAVVERMIGVLRDPFLLADEEIRISASIGVALSTLGYARAEDYLRAADTALYRVKHRGKGHYQVFDPREAAPDLP